jgi:diacylglycerol kinase (ATP)
VVATGRAIRYSGFGMVHLLSNAPRWLLLAALVYAPWAYGSIPPQFLAWLIALLGLTLSLWLLNCAVRQRLPQLPLWLIAAGAGVMVQAWWMGLNADPETGGTRSFRWAPGSVNQELSFGMALRVTMLVGVLWMVCDMAQHWKWRRRLWWTLALTGFSIVLLGLVQRIGGAPGTFWQYDLEAPTFFATFPYHANAGAFMNIVWPLMAGLLTLSMREQAASWQRGLWTVALVACLCGLFVNTSRGSGFVALLLVLLWLGWLLGRPASRWVSLNRPALLTRALAVLAVAGVIAMAIGVDRTLERWRGLEQELHAGNPRWQADLTSLRIISDAGATGFGPGTFARVYALYRGESRARLEHAHNDYLQTIIEWGFLGAAAWAFLVFGGPVRAVRAWIQGRGSKRTRDRILAFAGLAALLGLLLHALVDYPLQIPSIQLYTAVLLGFFWSFPQWNGRSTTSTSQTALGSLGDWMTRQPDLCPEATGTSRGQQLNEDSASGLSAQPPVEVDPLPQEQPAEVGVMDPTAAASTADAHTICVVFNPAARGEKARRLHQCLKELGVDCVLKPTTEPGAGRRLAAEAVRDGFHCVVAAGGDGTLNEVLNGIADEQGFDRVLLGVLPVGTSNVFARDLGLPLHWKQAWEVILRGNHRVIDLVQAVFETPKGRCQRHFVQLAGAGLDARAVELVDWQWKKRTGVMAYVAAGIRAMQEPQPQITIETGSNTLSGELVLIGNGHLYGGPYRLFPQADPRDGWLDAHIYSRANPSLAIACLWGLMTGRLGKAGRPRRVRSATLRLTASTRTPFQIDGEHVGYLPVELLVRPSALRVIVQ